MESIHKALAYSWRVRKRRGREKKKMMTQQQYFDVDHDHVDDDVDHDHVDDDDDQVPPP